MINMFTFYWSFKNVFPCTLFTTNNGAFSGKSDTSFDPNSKETEAGKLPLVQDHPGLRNEFKATPHHTVKSCLKEGKTIKMLKSCSINVDVFLYFLSQLSFFFLMCFYALLLGLLTFTIWAYLPSWRLTIFWFCKFLTYLLEYSILSQVYLIDTSIFHIFHVCLIFISTFPHSKHVCLSV